MDDIFRYELIIVGSVLKSDEWTEEPEAFLDKLQKELMKKRVAVFVSSGAQAIIAS